MAHQNQGLKKDFSHWKIPGLMLIFLGLVMFILWASIRMKKEIGETDKAALLPPHFSVEQEKTIPVSADASSAHVSARTVPEGNPPSSAANQKNVDKEIIYEFPTTDKILIQ